MTPVRLGKTLALLLPILAACATNQAIPAAKTVSLNINSAAISTTQHVISFNKKRVTRSTKENGSIENTNQTVGFGGAFARTVTEHTDGLLVSHTNIKIEKPDPSLGDALASPLQLSSIELTSLTFVAKPDYIMSRDGEFVRLYNYDQFEAAEKERIASILANTSDADKSKLSGLVDSRFDRSVHEASIAQELQVIKDVNATSLTKGEPLGQNITSAYADPTSKEYKAAGTLVYVGATECRFPTQSSCIELRFESSKNNVYNMRMIVDANTLALHDYSAVSAQGVSVADSKSKYEDNSTITFQHSVSQVQ